MNVLTECTNFCLIRVRDPSCRFTIIAAMLLLIILIPILILIYWLKIDTTPPIVVIESKVLGVLKGNPRTVIIERKVERNRYCGGVAYRWLVDGFVIELPPISVDPSLSYPIDNKGTDVYNVMVDVPDFIGNQLRYRSVIHYYCNPIQRAKPLVVSPPDIYIDISQLKEFDKGIRFFYRSTTATGVYP